MVIGLYFARGSGVTERLGLSVVNCLVFCSCGISDILTNSIKLNVCGAFSHLARVSSPVDRSSSRSYVASYTNPEHIHEPTLYLEFLTRINFGFMSSHVVIDIERQRELVTCYITEWWMI